MLKLSDSVTVLKGISDKTAEKLALLDISTVKDLITYFPRTYIDSSKITKIADLHAESNDFFTVKVTADNPKTIRLRGRRTIQRVELSDDTGKVVAMWFNQPYVLNSFKNTEREFFVRGKVKKKGNNYQFYPSSVDSDSENTRHLGAIIPEYNLTSGVGRKWFRNKIHTLCTEYLSTNTIDIPESVFIPDINELLINAHFPKESETFEQQQNRLAELELASIQIKLFNKKKKTQKSTFKISHQNELILQTFIENLPFELTNDQRGTIASIEKSLKSGVVLSELIQGDVGTGKTIIALYLAYLFALEKRQTIILAPTTVLAEQHYKNALESLPNHLKIELVTASTETNEPADILIGTTAVLARKMNLIDKLSLVIVDEQHRFGVRQREELLKPIAKENDEPVHLLDMTATPIPRTIAETFLGATGVHTIRTKPKGRKPIKTFIVPHKKRKDGFEWIASQLEVEKAQVYWIFPLIEESDAIKAKSLLNEAEIIKEKFSDYTVEVLHGRMKNVEKLEIMKNFKNGKIDILLSTTVIEVGVDNPNATIMVIENPERFGLAQLHQIRGRVGRGDKRSYCFLFLDKGKSSDRRIEFFAKENDGLKIAEFDLEQRGPGEVYGTKQSGVPEFKIADIMQTDVLEKSKNLVTEINNNKYQLELFV